MHDALGAARDLSLALGRPGQPLAAYEAFERLCAEHFGHRLFTLLAWHGGADEVWRVYSSRPTDYPVSARKRMGPTPWGQRVLREARPWLGRNADDIRWAFPDHELIARLGCAACINAPVRWNGGVVGSINVLDRAGAYTEPDLDLLDALSGMLAAPLLAERPPA